MKLKYNDWRLFTYLTKYIRPYLWLLILASIALISNLLCSLIRPYLSKQAIDLGFAMKDLNTIQHYAGLYALTIVGSIVFIGIMISNSFKTGHGYLFVNFSSSNI